jgi:membrane fusion protein, heavy metal efflux system
VPQGQIADAENELEGLRRRREVIRSIGGEREPLRASTDGVITAVKVTPGQVVQAQDLLVQIVDPKGLWVEALAYGAIDPDALANASAATTGGETMPLAYQGFSRALQNHASVLHFAIPEPPPNLSVGQPITVVATSGEPAVSGLIVRRDAVARAANGETIVWLQADAERFEPRPVRTMPFDAAHLTIAGGVAEGERVVVRGADLINQIR